MFPRWTLFLVLSGHKIVRHQHSTRRWLNYVRHFLDQRPDPHPPTDTLIRLSELIWQKNLFYFSGSFYVKKVVLRWVVILDVFCLPFGKLSWRKNLSKLSRPHTGTFQTFCWWWYRCNFHATLWSGELHILCLQFHPVLQFEYQISSCYLSFLDIKLQITDNRITTLIFYKETDSHSYFHSDSSHNPACITSVPFSELLRVRRLCSEDEDFKTKANEMSIFLPTANSHQTPYNLP